MVQVPLTVAAARSMVVNEVAVLDAASSGNIESRLLSASRVGLSRGANEVAPLSGMGGSPVEPLLLPVPSPFLM